MCVVGGLFSGAMVSLYLSDYGNVPSPSDKTVEMRWIAGQPALAVDDQKSAIGRAKYYYAHMEEQPIGILEETQEYMAGEVARVINAGDGGMLGFTLDEFNARLDARLARQPL